MFETKSEAIDNSLKNLCTPGCVREYWQLSENIPQTMLATLENSKYFLRGANTSDQVPDILNTLWGTVSREGICIIEKDS